MKKPETNTCECGRPEIGRKHCPVHGDGARQPTDSGATDQPGQAQPGRPRGRGKASTRTGK